MASAILGTGASAHRLDEYLQAARIEIGAGRVELELALTPGIALADAIITDIDRDHDGSLSPREQQVYTAKVLSAIDLEADGRPLDVHPIASSFPDVDAVRRGEGTIRLRSDAVLPSQFPGAHRLLFRNRHRRDVSVYLANAVAPVSARFGITAQRRDVDQRELTIDYVVDAAAARSGAALLLIAIAAATLAARLLLQRASKKVGS
jgi:hypothetical protein